MRYVLNAEGAKADVFMGPLWETVGMPIAR